LGLTENGPLLALFGPDAPGRRCPLIGEEQKFAARCQSDAIDPKGDFDPSDRYATEGLVHFPPDSLKLISSGLPSMTYLVSALRSVEPLQSR
jgi:hypothetical protein